jgi:uroporphyrinogen-III synthase
MSKKILYLGLDPTRYACKGEVFHLPLIKIVHRPFQEVEPTLGQLTQTTHVILTSRTAAHLLCDYANQASQSLSDKIFLTVGQATAAALYDKGFSAIHVALQETGEGVVDLLKILPNACHIFYPHSAIARPLIADYLKKNSVSFTATILYDTVARHVQLPDLNDFEEIIFTSPSTVAAFFACTTHIPPYEKCIPLGPITARALEIMLGLLYSRLNLD